MPERPEQAGTVEVFFSYAHEDLELCKRLQQHFSFLRREGKTVHWYDGEIKPGKDWRGEIEEHLNSADVILLLVSAAFADSDFCYSVEMVRAMERHDAGEAVVVPILLHPCDWQNAPFAKLQALPGGEAISEWPKIEKALYEVARGVREVVEDLIARRPAGARVAPAEELAPAVTNVPPPPAIEFVQRKDRDGHDIVERLQRELMQHPKRLIVLWGEGGVGKTTIAAEAARALSGVFGERIIWASAEKRADFTYSTLLNEIAIQLGDAELTKLATEPKEQAVRQFIAAAPTLVILDNFETVSPEEKKLCADFLTTRAQCPALITTREKVFHDAARHVHVESMADEEARQFVARWINQEAHDPRAFDGLDYDEIIRSADARPYVLQWVLAQIDLALEPCAVLAELARAEGEVGERVFKRSFDLPQLGDDGRDALLALALFTSGASRPAVAEVAGFGDDHNRLNEAVKRLAALRLIETMPGHQRLAVQGLTRSLAQSCLSEDKRADNFRRRYIACFLRHAEAYTQRTPEDLDALETEKDNLLGAMDMAFGASDWESVMRIRRALENLLFLHAYWNEAIRSGEQAEAAARESKNEFQSAFFTLTAGRIRIARGEYDEAHQIYREALKIFRRLESEENVSICFNQLGIIAAHQGNFEEARQHYDESLKINKRLGNHRNVATTGWNLGVMALKQGKIDEAKRLFTESLDTFTNLKDQASAADVLHWLGVIAHRQNEYKEARRLYGESLEINKRLGKQGVIAQTLNQLGLLAWDQGALEEARRLLDESLEMKKRFGDQGGIARTSRNLGLLTEVEGDKEEAAQLFRKALHIWEKLSSPEAENVRRDLARVEAKSN